MLQIFQADITRGIPEIADESIDAIITDPLYKWDAIELWYALGLFARRFLKPSGKLLAMSGQMYLPSIHAALRLAGNGELLYHWENANFQSRRGGVYLCYGAHKIQYWKPICEYYKPPLPEKYTGDVFYSDRVPDKKLNKMQQNLKVFNQIICYHTKREDTICDPFMCTGTTGLAALGWDRNFIGCDIDPVNVQIAERRLRTTRFITQWFK